MVGAGFAGLAAADELRRAGVAVHALEARERVGGRVWSVPFAGTVVERGAEFVLPDYAAMRAAVERFALPLVRKGTLYGFREPRGGAPVSLRQLAAAIELIGTLEPGAGTVPEALARYRLDPAVAEAICARVEVSCTYSADDLDERVLSEGAGSFGEFETHTVAGGNDRLARAFAEELGASVVLRTPVREIVWSGSEVRVRADELELAADAAVLAVPASVTAEIAFEPPLPPAKVAALRSVRYGQAAKLFVRLRTPAPPSATLSVPDRYWCYTQQGAGGRPLPYVAAFAGTPAALERLGVAGGPERWIEAVRALRPDLDLDPENALLSRWDDDPWVRGSYSALSAHSPLDTAALTLPVGRLAFAGEHAAGEWHGLMEGALRSGQRAATELLGRRR